MNTDRSWGVEGDSDDAADEKLAFSWLPFRSWFADTKKFDGHLGE